MLFLKLQNTIVYLSIVLSWDLETWEKQMWYDFKKYQFKLLALFYSLSSPILETVSLADTVKKKLPASRFGLQHSSRKEGGNTQVS